ncbi:hypothetical protein ACFL5O_05660 [Myxococcota bacterium]
MQLAGVSVCSCGYRPAFAVPEPAENLSVAVAPPLVAEVDAVRCALAGAQSELSRFGALAGGPGYPRLLVEVTRVDEKAGGIAIAGPPDRPSLIPLARASRVGVAGRAWVEESFGAEPSRDVGDVRRTEEYAPLVDPRFEALAHQRALCSAGSELGRALARRVLGVPEPAMEPM